MALDPNGKGNSFNFDDLVYPKEDVISKSKKSTFKERIKNNPMGLVVFIMQLGWPVGILVYLLVQKLEGR